jgi:epoxyqueuosine reductase
MYLRHAMEFKQEDKPQTPESNVQYIIATIKDFVIESPANRLPSFNNEPIFDEPLIGFARGDDPIFEEYKRTADSQHLTPREVFDSFARERGAAPTKRAALSVISFVLPISRATRLSLRRESLVPSLRWNHTRFQGQDFIIELCRHIITEIETLGHSAIAPEFGKSFAMKNTDRGYVSNWSQRHMAYAAGLGTFSLNDGFITPKGMAMRCGSLVTDLPLAATPRPYKNHLSNCLFYRNGTCGRCIQRCPAGAISEKGHDKIKCLEYLFNGTRSALQEMGRYEGYLGYYPACGMCQTKVPCESMIPPDIKYPKPQQEP